MDERVKTINKILQKNRQVLQNVLNKGLIITKIKKEKLLEEGFVFKYYTHLVISKKGTHYLLCYDYGYLNMAEGWCLIFKEDQLPPY